MSQDLIIASTLDDVESGNKFYVSQKELKALLKIHWGKLARGTNGTTLELADYGDGNKLYIKLPQGGIAAVNKIKGVLAANLLSKKSAVIRLFPNFFSDDF